MKIIWKAATAIVAVARGFVGGFVGALRRTLRDINDQDRIARGASDFANPPRPAPMGAP